MKEICLILICFLSMAPELAWSQSTIQNGQFWYDTQGNRIEAHGAGIIRHNGKWYMIGEDKSQGFTFTAVNLYSSTDLENWTFENDIINTSSHSQLADGSRFIERPKLIYNDQTGQFIVWCHWEGPQSPGGATYGTAELAVFTSSTIDGDYTFHHSERPFDNMSRDCNIFKDDDGSAYFVSAANENADLMIYEMTSDYLNLQRHVVTLFNGQWREAPVIFKKDGVYFLLTSAATGWDPNQGKYATATSMDGPWSGLSNFANSTTYDSQPTTFIKVEGSQETTYIYCGDRWQDPDLASSKYVWMPFSINGTDLSLPAATSWDIDVNTGVVSNVSNSGGIVSGYTYRINVRNSGRALDANGTANNSPVIVYDYWGGQNQKWTIQTTSNGYYRFVNEASGRSLDVGGTSNNSPVQIYDYWGGDNQQWAINDLGNGYFSITSRASGRALDIGGSSNNSPAQIYDYWGGQNQQFQFTTVGSGSRTAANQNEGERERDLEQATAKEVLLFPNPVMNDVLNITLPKAFHEGSDIAIMNSAGQVIRREHNVNTKIESFNIGDFESGIYLVKISNDIDVFTKKFIKN